MNLAGENYRRLRLRRLPEVFEDLDCEADSAFGNNVRNRQMTDLGTAVVKDSLVHKVRDRTYTAAAAAVD